MDLQQQDSESNREYYARLREMHDRLSQALIAAKRKAVVDANEAELKRRYERDLEKVRG